MEEKKKAREALILIGLFLSLNI